MEHQNQYNKPFYNIGTRHIEINNANAIYFNYEISLCLIFEETVVVCLKGSLRSDDAVVFCYSQDGKSKWSIMNSFFNGDREERNPKIIGLSRSDSNIIVYTSEGFDFMIDSESGRLLDKSWSK